MKTWIFTVKVKVADSWVADGFDMSERLEDVEESICAMLPYAYEHEIEVTATIKIAPTQEQINALQSGEAEIKD